MSSKKWVIEDFYIKILKKSSIGKISGGGTTEKPDPWVYYFTIDNKIIWSDIHVNVYLFIKKYLVK